MGLVKAEQAAWFSLSEPGEEKGSFVVCSFAFSELLSSRICKARFLYVPLPALTSYLIF